MSTFSLLRNGATAAPSPAEAAGSASEAGSLKPKSVRSGRAGAESSGFSAPAASAGASVRFRFFAMASAWARKRGGGGGGERLRPEGQARGREHDGELGFKPLGRLGPGCLDLELRQTEACVK